jgi:serine/threonine protein kinase
LKLSQLPRDIPLDPGQIEILRYLGSIDTILDKTMLSDMNDSARKAVLKNFGGQDRGRVTTVRIFEARVGVTRCFLKEYTPVGISYGKRERKVSRYLVKTWNSNLDEMVTKGDNPYNFPFPLMLGSLRTDERVEDPFFKKRWADRFGRVSSPDCGNIWLVFKWDEASFRAVSRFPPLPQVVQGMDYFSKEQRNAKRWQFIRKVMKSSLVCLDFFHKNGYCHGSLSSESIWLSTTNQLEMSSLYAKFTDLGNSVSFEELGPSRLKAAFEDIFLLGLIFLELIFASFADDTMGARNARKIMSGSMDKVSIFDAPEPTQLNFREIETLFVSVCDSDFAKFRALIASIGGYEDAIAVLEDNNGSAWKVIFRMLARGRLSNNDGSRMNLTPNAILRQGHDLFIDV